MTCARCEGIAVRRRLAVPEEYLDVAAAVRGWVADGILRELHSTWPLAALPDRAPLPEALLARPSAGHWVACTSCAQLFHLSAIFEREGLWAPWDAADLPPDHAAVTALRRS